MLRYVAFLWDDADTHSSVIAKDLGQRLSHSGVEWVPSLSSAGLELFTVPSRFDCYATHSLGSTGGAVLGLLFGRSEPRIRSNAQSLAPFFDQDERDRITASAGRRLVEAYWGRYVAFLNDSATRTKRVLRDPLGDIPCYRASVRGIEIYFSSIPDFLQLQCLQLSVNWKHLAARMITGNAWAEESALNEIETVHPGECIQHQGAAVSRQYYWHPFTVAKSAPLEDFEAAAAELRVVTKQCASQWASLHENAVHILSGGLDSSIVLGCLADTPSRPNIACLNFRTRDPDSDERVFARLAAARAGSELHEIERLPVLALERIFDCPPTVGPRDLVMRGLEVQPLIAQFAHSHRATAMFSGDGGDIVFFRGWPQLAVVDYAREKGMGWDLVKLAREAALPAQLSVWRLLYDAVRQGTLHQDWDIKSLIFDHYRLVTDAVTTDIRKNLDFLNPWNFPVGDLPPGKLFHAFGVTRPSLFRDPLLQEPDLDIINPLMCQPVVEVCLRIPTYTHAAHGKDRAVARAAFAAELPREIALRTWKGAADRHLKDLMFANIELIREVLVEGVLVKAGILDPGRLAAALSGVPTRSTTHPTEIFGYFCTEAWLRQWTARHQVLVT